MLRTSYTARNSRKKERGNALLYVLIAVALFAALSFTLSDQTDTQEAAYLSQDKAELYASQIISYAAQAKSAIDQMMFTGTRINDLDFTKPGEAGFDTAPHINKVFHPQGGGLNLYALNESFSVGRVSDPTPPGVYFTKKNVEWTPTTGDDITMAFYRLKEEVCDQIIKKIDGTKTQMGGSLYDTFATDNIAHPLNSTTCAACDEKMTYAVYRSSQKLCVFYSVVADQ